MAYVRGAGRGVVRPALTDPDTLSLPMAIASLAVSGVYFATLRGDFLPQEGNRRKIVTERRLSSRGT
jgi:hypothetical protein